MLNTRLEAADRRGSIDRADMVDAMEDAGTVDLRGQEVLPLLLQVMGPTAPGRLRPARAGHARPAGGMGGGGRAPPRLRPRRRRTTIRRRRRSWTPGGRRSRTRSSMPRRATPSRTWGSGSHDAPQGHEGSAFGGGVYSHVEKDLRQALGLPGDGPVLADVLRRRRAGDVRVGAVGVAGARRRSLQAEFGSPNVANWKRTVADDDVRSSAIGVGDAAGVPLDQPADVPAGRADRRRLRE